MRSLFSHRSLTIHNFAFTVQRALALTVHKTFIVRSSFSKRSAIFIRNSNVKGSFLKHWQNKDWTCAEWWVKTYLYIRNFLINYKASGLSTSKFGEKSVCYKFKLSLNKNAKENQVCDRSQVHRANKKRSISLICLHYKIFSLIYIYFFFLLGVQTALSTKVIRYGIAFVNCFVRCMYVLPKYTRNAVSLEVLKIKFNVWLRSGLASISAQVDFKQQL